MDNYYYKNFIDLTNEITDHKIKLQISTRKELKPLPSKKSVEKKSSKKYDSFGLFGTSNILVSSFPEDEEEEQDINALPEQEEMK